MKVKEVMTRPVASVQETASLADAARCMWDHDCGIVPVLDGGARLKGVITDRDVCMGGLTQAVPLTRIPVARSMAREVFACQEVDDVKRVHELMREHRVRRVPIVDDARGVVGMVSIRDLAAAARKAKGAAKRSLETEVAKTLEALSAPTALQPADLAASVGAAPAK